MTRGQSQVNDMRNGSTDEADQVGSVKIVEGIGSFDAIDFENLSCAEIERLEFVSLQAAYDFCNEYGRIKGFSIRRSKVGRSTKVGCEREIIWQIFVCSRQGEREWKHMYREDRKMDPRPMTAVVVLE